jgi:ATP/ADP translocase
MYVNLIRKYGVFGLAVITPVFISIPIGSFLAARFFSKQKFMITMLMVMSVVLWAVSISTFLYLI